MLVEERNLKERIKKAQERDEKIVKAVEELKRAGIKTLRDEKWEIENRMVMKEEQIYVPEGELRGEVIQLHHDTPVDVRGHSEASQNTLDVSGGGVLSKSDK